MTDIIATLHPENDSTTNLYPNIKNDNIPLQSITPDKLNVGEVMDFNILSTINCNAYKGKLIGVHYSNEYDKISVKINGSCLFIIDDTLKPFVIDIVEGIHPHTLSEVWFINGIKSRDEANRPTLSIYTDVSGRVVYIHPYVTITYTPSIL